MMVASGPKHPRLLSNMPEPAAGPVMYFLVFYSEDSNEKETDSRANHLTADFGDGKKVGQQREATSRRALRSVRDDQRPGDRSEFRTSVLGLPPIKN